MNYAYTPRGVCSRKIEIDLADDGVIRSVKFTGGCSGNAAGISKLVAGMKAQEVIGRLRGTTCSRLRWKRHWPPRGDRSGRRASTETERRDRNVRSLQ